MSSAGPEPHKDAGRGEPHKQMQGAVSPTKMQGEVSPTNRCRARCSPAWGGMGWAGLGAMISKRLIMKK